MLDASTDLCFQDDICPYHCFPSSDGNLVHGLSYLLLELERLHDEDMLTEMMSRLMNLPKDWRYATRERFLAASTCKISIAREAMLLNAVARYANAQELRFCCFPDLLIDNL
jgi:hypothetical protein